MSMFLSPEEVTELTGKKQRPTQVLALKTMGIEHMVRPDGGIVVSRSHVERRLDGHIQLGLQSELTEPEIDWGEI